MSETLFKQDNYTVGSLIRFIELGTLGLPDIQREFRWKNIKLRDLFDSMYFTSLLSRSESPRRHQAA